MVTVTAPNQEKGDAALEWIKKITYIPKAGDVFDGTVTRLMEFGAFVEFAPGKEGLVHISQMDYTRVNKVEDICKVGDKMKVKLMEIDDQGRYNLSRKALLPIPEGGIPPEQTGGGFGARRPSGPPRRSGGPRRF